MTATTTSSTNKTKNKQIHDLYHEAKRRAGLPKLPVKHLEAKSLLLSAPNNIIFELFSTVVKEVPTDRLLTFVEGYLRVYLDSHWDSKLIKQIIRRLRREQAIDVRAGLANVPPLRLGANLGHNKTVNSDSPVARSPRNQPPRPQTSPTSPPSQTPSSPTADQTSEQTIFGPDNKSAAIDQVYEHIMWRIKTDNVTQITSLLIKLVLDDGYKTNKLKAEAYDDVSASFEHWRGQLLVKLYAFGAAPATDQKLILASTNQGDLTKWVANYIDGSEKRQNPDLIRKLAMALRDKHKNCIFLTHQLVDALQALETGALRCAFVVDRLNQYDHLESLEDYKSKLEPLLVSGKLYIMSSLRCVEFAPDPENDTCC